MPTTAAERDEGDRCPLAGRSARLEQDALDELVPASATCGTSRVVGGPAPETTPKPHPCRWRGVAIAAEARADRPHLAAPIAAARWNDPKRAELLRADAPVPA